MPVWQDRLNCLWVRRSKESIPAKRTVPDAQSPASAEGSSGDRRPGAFRKTIDGLIVAFPPACLPRPKFLRSTLMQKRRLGRTDLHVSAICLGTMTWGQQNTEADGHAQMDLAFDRGVNFLDTAELYPIPPKPETQGRTETYIGNWMKARKNRDKVDPRHQGGRAHAEHLVSRRPPVEAGARRHFRRDRQVAEAAADRLCRSLPDPFPGARRAMGRQPDAGRHDAAAPRRGRDADRRDARGVRRTGEGRQDPPSRPVERELVGRDALHRRERQGRRPASGLAAERLQSRQPHLRGEPRRDLRARGGRACSPIRRSRRAISPANTTTARGRPARARRCSTAASATRRRARPRRCSPTTSWRARSAWSRRCLPMPMW